LGARIARAVASDTHAALWAFFACARASGGSLEVGEFAMLGVVT